MGRERAGGSAFKGDSTGNSICVATMNTGEGLATSESAAPSTSLKRCSDGSWMVLLCESPGCVWNCCQCSRRTSAGD